MRQVSRPLKQPPDRAPLLTVLMPAWNEEENLASNVPLLMGKLDALAVDYELLIVDGGSSPSEVVHGAA